MVEIHELKTHHIYFDQTWKGNKKFEVRLNDRNFQVNDIVVLKETISGAFTGRNIISKISYIMDEPEFCMPLHVIFQLCEMKLVDHGIKQGEHF